jgi:hypothetical protein
MRQVLLVLLVVALLGGGRPGFAEAEGGWREEFDRICARTGEAGTMSEVELDRLIVDSEKVREQIEASNEPDRKVYLFRIGKCRDFFVFMKDAAKAQRP